MDHSVSPSFMFWKPNITACSNKTSSRWGTGSCSLTTKINATSRYCQSTLQQLARQGHMIKIQLKTTEHHHHSRIPRFLENSRQQPRSASIRLLRFLENFHHSYSNTISSVILRTLIAELSCLHTSVSASVTLQWTPPHLHTSGQTHPFKAGVSEFNEA